MIVSDKLTLFKYGRKIFRLGALHDIEVLENNGVLDEEMLMIKWYVYLFQTLRSDVYCFFFAGFPVFTTN